jgi:type I restriction enzyme S subunit
MERSRFALVRSQNVFDRRFDRTGLAFISDEQAGRLKGAALQEGDLLLNITGDGVTFSRACAVPLDILPACVNQHVAIIRVDRQAAEPGFVLAYLTHDSIKSYIESFNAGGSRRAITKGHIESLQLALPPLQEQRAIASILGSFDAKIELNRRMSEALEETALAVFKSWFVDFDPVRAKIGGRSLGLSRNLAELFPARVVDSELGKIPQGWEVAPLPKAIEVNPARSLLKGAVAPFLDMANMSTQIHSPNEVIDRPFESGMRFVNGDTLVARITPCLENGKTAYVDFLEEGQTGWGSTEYIVLRPKLPLPEEYAYCLARSDGFRDFAIQSMTGSSGRQRVPVESLGHFRIVVPPRPVAKSFGTLVKPLLARVRNANKESRILAAVRQNLLPKLVSGELQLRNAERFIQRKMS